MSDNQSVCSKVTSTIKKKLRGYDQNRVAVIALMVSGIVTTRKARLSSIAEEAPTESKDLSTLRRLQRFVDNDRVDVQHCNTYSLTGYMLWARYDQMNGKPMRTPKRHLSQPPRKPRNEGLHRSRS